MPRPGVSGFGFALISAICFGFSGPLAKALLDAGLSPLQVVWIRLAGAAIVLLVVTVVFRPGALVIPRDRIAFVAFYSLVGFAAVQAFYYGAVARLPVAIAILVEYTSPVLVVLWVRLVRKVALPRAAIFGAGLAIAGLACVVEVWRGLPTDLVGLAFGLATAVCAAAYFVLTQDAGEGLQPLGTVTWGLVGATVVLIPLGRPWDLPWHLLGDRLRTGDGTVPGWQLAGGLVLIATVAAYLASVAAVRRLSATIGAIASSMEVVTSIVIAWLLLGESLGAIQLVGGAIILSGVVLAQLAASRGPETVAVPLEAQPVGRDG